MASTIVSPDVLIVGSGLMGAAVARQIRDARPEAVILMVDGGSPIGSVPGRHLQDSTEAGVREAYLHKAAPGIQSLYLGAHVTPVIEQGLGGVRPGMYNVSAFRSDADCMPGASLAWNAGGMGVHWTAATPWPWGDEVFAHAGAGDWDEQLRAARDLLHVDPAPFVPQPVGARVIELLDGVFGRESAAGRHPQPMPMAATPTAEGPVLRTGPARIFPRLAEPAGDDFELRAGTLAVELVHDAGHVTGARVRDVATGDISVIEAAAIVVAADTFRTPQLLFASGIRPPALGCYLNEHAFLTGRVLADPAILGLELDDIPFPRDDDFILGHYWLPQSGEAQPFHGQIMDNLYADAEGERLAYSVGISLYVPTEIRAENRLEFSDEETDVSGMPRITVHFDYSPTDLATIDRARESQRRGAEAFGDFDADRDSTLLAAGSSLHFTGTARAGEVDDGTSVCDPSGCVWGFDNLWLAGGAVVPTAVVGNSTLTGMVTAVRAARAVVAEFTRRSVDVSGAATR